MSDDLRVPLDEVDALRRILAMADALLLDFDGPICSVFAGYPAAVIADQLREVLADGGHSALPADVAKSEDPFDVFAYAATLSVSDARYVEAAMRAHEVEAVATAEPTAGAHNLIRAWHSSGRKLAIVSNNGVAAVETYLELYGISSHVDTVSARSASDPSLLKPNPFLLQQACKELDIPESKCVFIGDSLTDLVAAQSAAMPAIGYANKPGKAELFADAGSELITTSISLIAHVLQ